MVVEKGISTNNASKKLKINYSTAKAILKSYRTKGAVFKRKFEQNDPAPESPKEKLPQNPAVVKKSNESTNQVEIVVPTNHREQTMEVQKNQNYLGYTPFQLLSFNSMAFPQNNYQQVYMINYMS